MRSRRVAASANRTLLNTHRRTDPALRALLQRLEKEDSSDAVLLKQRTWLQAALPFLHWDFLCRFEGLVAKVWPPNGRPPHAVVDALGNPETAIFLFLLIKNFLLHRLQPLHNDYVQERFESTDDIQQAERESEQNMDVLESLSSEDEENSEEMDGTLLYGTSSMDQMSRKTQQVEEQIRELYRKTRTKKSEIIPKPPVPNDEENEQEDEENEQEDEDKSVGYDNYSISSDEFTERNIQREGITKIRPTESHLEAMSTSSTKEILPNSTKALNTRLPRKSGSRVKRDRNGDQGHSADEGHTQAPHRISPTPHLSSVVQVTSASDSTIMRRVKPRKRARKAVKKSRRRDSVENASGVEEVVSDAK